MAPEAIGNGFFFAVTLLKAERAFVLIGASPLSAMKVVPRFRRHDTRWAFVDGGSRLGRINADLGCADSA